VKIYQSYLKYEENNFPKNPCIWFNGFLTLNNLILFMESSLLKEVVAV
jgi:hypothetical protein